MSLALVCRDATFFGTKKALVHYAEALRLEYGVNFVNACIKDIVNETLSFEYLPIRSRVTYG